MGEVELERVRKELDVLKTAAKALLATYYSTPIYSSSLSSAVWDLRNAVEGCES